ncbi:hypothetical protein BLNAU_15443 [Blattamonas nauphoetae]|uniref:Uncharacterized protein n=1 Tax=Blattamonas nauphoetae TaxID=2049346 RepID=A0ABQ9XAM5_9EUKA|nr:hypothetical protein BLNAU_15443 [Blattamonas nauphoetae]
MKSLMNESIKACGELTFPQMELALNTKILDQLPKVVRTHAKLIVNVIQKSTFRDDKYLWREFEDPRPPRRGWGTITEILQGDHESAHNEGANIPWKNEDSLSC